jgi:hypothetical protein
VSSAKRWVPPSSGTTILVADDFDSIGTCWGLPGPPFQPARCPPPHSTLIPDRRRSDAGGGGKSGRTLACLMNVTFCDGKSRKCARRWCW